MLIILVAPSRRTLYLLYDKKRSRSRVIQYLLIAYNSRKGADAMKEIIHTQNSFKAENAEQLKKAVTEKVEKLINRQVKKAG